MFETVAVPFKTIGNRQCLTELQIVQNPWLAEFIAAFPACFEHDITRQIWVFDPDGTESRS